MGYALIMMKNVTEAEKAKYVLNRAQVFSVVEKTSAKTAGGGGCAFGIKVSANPDYVCHILSTNGIACGDVRVNWR